MRFRLLLPALALVLAACQQGATPSAQTGNAPAVAAGAQVELIPRSLLFGNPERSNVQISPDGAHLGWLAPKDGVMNVWVAPAGDLARAQAMTADTGRGIREYYWSQRPGTLLYLRDNGGDEDFHLHALDIASGKSLDLSPYAHTRAYLVAISPAHPESILVSMNDRDPKWHDLYRVDLASGARTLLERNTRGIADFLVDGDYRLHYATHARDDGGTDVLKRKGSAWVKYDDIPFSDSLTTWLAGMTADGSTLYVADSRNRNTAAWLAIDTASDARTLVLEDARADVNNSLVDPATGKVQAVAVEYQTNEWRAVDPAIARDLKTLDAIGPGDFAVTSRTLDDSQWIVSYSAADTPTVYYRYDRKGGGALTKLFSAIPALEGKPLVPMWPLEIQARDGLTLVSYLALPAEADGNRDGRADKPVPLVLLVHGGPWARVSYGYNGLVQWLANRGYAVLSVNFRGSTGFGKAFVNKADGEWAGKMQDDLNDAVAWAVSQGVTRQDSVAIMGGSYGGYATLVGMSFTPDAFKCGVDIVGPSNLNTLLATIPPYWATIFEQFARRLGDPRTAAGKQLLEERSPLNRAARIRRPLLIGQGANDPRVKQAESDQIVKAMQANAIPVTYVVFPDEGHGFARPENLTAFNAVSENFLAQCLGGRAQPIGNDLAGSSITVPTGASGVPGLSEALKTHTASIRN